MKPVSLNSAATSFLRQGNQVSGRRLSSMETCIETGDLRHVGQELRNCFDSPDVVRLVQRGQGCQSAQFSEHLWCHNRRSRVARPTVYNAMPNAHDRRATIHRLQPSSQLVKRVAAIAELVEFTVENDLPCSAFRDDPGRTPDSIYLAARFQTPIVFW